MAVEAVRQAMNGPRDHIDQLVTGPNASIGPPTTFKRPVPENIPEVEIIFIKKSLNFVFSWLCHEHSTRINSQEFQSLRPSKLCNISSYFMAIQI